MLIDFVFSNYKSFRDSTTLSMQAEGLKEHRDSLLEAGDLHILPCAAVYGKNGGGKSNLLRALWLGVQFICNAQRTQHDGAPVPVSPFALDEDSRNRPTFFEYTYVFEGIKYRYGFAATRKEITREYLYYWPKRNRATIFERSGQSYKFPQSGDKKRREIITDAVASNQLYLVIASALNYEPCIQASRWFREAFSFSRDFVEIPRQLRDYSDNKKMLDAIVNIAKHADIGIENMSFEFQDREIRVEDTLPEEMPEGAKTALAQFFQALSSDPNEAEGKLTMSEVKALSYHHGINPKGDPACYPLDLAEESDGTRKLMALAPPIEKTLENGGVLVVDEIETRLHPLLVKYIVSRFQNPEKNPNKAQLIFTTHSTELLEMDLLRKDQIYFADKKSETGISELYSISDMKTRTGENIRKGYLLGKYGAIPYLEEDEEVKVCQEEAGTEKAQQ